MAFGSTDVGRAHVDVSVDGSKINDGIVDAIDDATDDAGSIGERAGKVYGERFSKASLARMRSNLGRRLSNLVGEEMTNRLKTKTGQLGRALTDMANDTKRGAAEAGETLGEEMGDGVVEGLRKRLLKTDDVISRLLDQVAGTGDKKRLAYLTHALRSAQNEATVLDRQIRAIILAEAGMSGRDGGVGGRRGRRGDSPADRIGSMLGMGGRSDVLHYMGKITSLGIKGMMGAMNMFTKSVSMAQNGVSSLIQAFQSGGMKGVGQTLLGGASKGMSSLGAAAASAGPAIVAVVVALSALVSVLGALLALLTSIAAAITSALVGALAVAGGAAAALAVSVGLVTAAFMSMTEAQREALSADFRPLKEMMVGIGQEVLGPMSQHFATWSSNLQRALLVLAPLAAKVGEAVGQAGSRFTELLSGPGFQKLSQMLGIYLPGIIRSLSSAFGQFLNGLAGMFAAVMPYVQQFGNYLEAVATRFANFASSAQGQNSISNFVSRAVESLKSLWNAVREVSGFIADVFFNPAVQQAGATVFDGIANTFANLRDMVAEAYANGDLQRWLEDGINFGAQLWGVIEAVAGSFIAFYNSGVLHAIGGALEVIGYVIEALNPLISVLVDLVGVVLPAALAAALLPLATLASATMGIVEGLKWIGGKVGIGDGGDVSKALGPLQAVKDLAAGSFKAFQNPAKPGGEGWRFNPRSGANFRLPNLKLGDTQPLINKGNIALRNTYERSGGYMPDPKAVTAAKKNGESLRKVLRRLYSQLENDMRGLRDAANPQEVRDGLAQMRNRIKDAVEGRGAGAQRMGRQALNTLAGQGEVSSRRVNRLMKGIKVQNATMADYAEARAKVSRQLEKANEKLAEALEMRKEFRKGIIDSVKSFGSILTAEAKVIDGVTQALTADDITDNLRNRLDKIKKFQSDLQLLSAMGLSKSAYKQLVEAGVEEGGAFAEALLAGGYGSVQDMNNLVSQINSAAKDLGTEAADRMYAAGVNAAQGLVAGLESLSARLDNAASRLGNRIAKALRNALGIKSPSRVMIAAMGDVGDGIAQGLDQQQPKVASAMSRLSSQIAVSPEVAAYSSRQAAAGGVSGNQNTFDLTVITPTEDPRAVAMETMNEITGRLL